MDETIVLERLYQKYIEPKKIKRDKNMGINPYRKKNEMHLS